ncbi:RusA family crossover junction endodeoxyribonuclease [Latilactobacillus curvatus]|uniref:RusA family crossover junction endodeoxyribonuclease n=1 Tax=Latilactobacillus curvatus TaxID=28038 RepID=UPI0022F3E90A|nr:RusA family crossover junction endodeoxyribonuclease [Latilactobacillus curvatus]WBY48128.1 RusA family crossover junction endodeoxyribonuclease [Latilactobacillus curvatus]
MKLVIVGEPVAAGRPRFSSRGGFVKAYDPKKSRDYKALIKQCFAKQIGSKPLTGPLEVTIRIYRPIQKSISQKERARRLLNKVKPTVKPDVDNYIKIALDGLNGLAWVDDNQIIKITAIKYYSDEPKMEVEVNGS